MITSYNTYLSHHLSRKHTNVPFAWRKRPMLIDAYSFAVGKEHANHVMQRTKHVIKVSKSSVALFVGTQILVALVRNDITMY